MLASRDEEASEVAAYDEALTVEKHVEVFADQIHGWMASRADLEDEAAKEGFEKGYRIVADWFARYV